MTGVRHLMAVQRKIRLCRCGCRGWCSLWPVLHMIHWSSAALAEGEFPGRPCVGVAWSEAAEAIGGGLLALRGALLHIKLDWGEAASSMAFPNWASALHPCFGCNCERDSMQYLADTPELPFEELSWEDYDEACALSERVVVLSTPMELQTVLHFQHVLCSKCRTVCKFTRNFFWQSSPVRF